MNVASIASDFTPCHSVVSQWAIRHKAKAKKEKEKGKGGVRASEQTTQTN